MPAKKAQPAGAPRDYEPKTSAHCRDAEHGACDGRAFNARTSSFQSCACPCHKTRVKLS